MPLLNLLHFFLGPTENTEPKALFGGTSFGSTNATNASKPNIFGGNTNGDKKPSAGFSFKLPSSTTVTPIGPNVVVDSQPTIQTSTPVTEEPKELSTAAPMFGSTGMSFADLAKNTSTNSTPVAFGSPGGLSFASLAQNNSNGSPSFGQTSASGGFIGLSNKDTFSNLMAPQNGTAQNPSKDNNDEDNENATDEAYDPHYDPIIALPDEIQVSTGEENEEKLFGDRAKLYRFDSENKEVCLY